MKFLVLKDDNVKPINRRPLRTFIQRESKQSKSAESNNVDEELDSELSAESNNVDEESDSELSLEMLPPASVSKRNSLFSKCKSLFQFDLDWIRAFYDAGLYSFLRTDAGGSNSPKNSKITCQRLSSYISWVFKHHIEFCNDSRFIPSNALLIVMELLVKNPQYVGGFMEFLSRRKASPSTKLTILCQLRKCATWTILFSPEGTQCDQQCFEKICNNIYRACSKQNRLRILRKGNIDLLVKTKRWPEGGYAELREHVLTGGCEFFDGLLANVNSGYTLTSSDYCRLLRVLLTLMYLTSHQGRPNAITHLKLGEVTKLLNNEKVYSTKFKTRFQYKYQIITLSEVSKKYLRIYSDVIRPLLNAPTRSDSFFFVKFNGVGPVDVGRKVREYFNKYTKYKLSTNSIRSIVETSVHSLHEKGYITESDVSACARLSGHSSAVARDYYTRYSINKDAERFRNVWQKMQDDDNGDNTSREEEKEVVEEEDDDEEVEEKVVEGEVEEEGEVDRNNNVSVESDLPEGVFGGYVDWGMNRSSKDNCRRCRGFPWTALELKIVREWKFLNPSGNIKGCLEYIYATEGCRKEFHVHHIINTARLLTAWRKV